LRSDEQDIVGVLRPEPARASFQLALRRAADTGFERSGNHLLERRIGNQRVRQLQGCVGSAQLSSMA